MSKNNEKFLVVTTAHKGVFAGLGVPSDAENIELTEARMCVYWSTNCKGVLGLASAGPTKSCKIGPPVQKIILRGVTAVIEATEDAAKAWRAQPWS